MEAIFKQANAVFIQRYATAAEWTANNPIIYPGEIGIESDTGKIKVGGTQPSAWRELDYSSSDGAQIIHTLDTIYNDIEDLPSVGEYDGQQLVTKNNGGPPLFIYRWIAQARQWISISQVKETVVYLAKHKDNSTNILCFYDGNTNSFISISEQKQIVIADIDTIYPDESSLNASAPKEDGNVYVAFNRQLQIYGLYKYVASSQSWAFLGAINEHTIYSNKNPSRLAPANCLWRVETKNGAPNFIRQGYDADIAQQIGNIASALTELHSYAQTLIEGGV